MVSLTPAPSRRGRGRRDHARRASAPARARNTRRSSGHATRGTRRRRRRDTPVHPGDHVEHDREVRLTVVDDDPAAIEGFDFEDCTRKRASEVRLDHAGGLPAATEAERLHVRGRAHGLFERAILLSVEPRDGVLVAAVDGGRPVVRRLDSDEFTVGVFQNDRGLSGIGTTMLARSRGRITMLLMTHCPRRGDW